MHRRLLVSALLVFASACTSAPAADPAPPPRSSADLTAALLTEEDLAGEGGGTQVELPQVSRFSKCETEQPTANAITLWQLKDGRTVTQTVETFGNAVAVVDALRGNETCLPSVTMIPASGPVLGDLPVDAQHGWCVDHRGHTCGSAVAKGDLVVVIEANADDQPTASALVARLMPRALKRLGVPVPSTTTAPAEPKGRTSAELVPAALTPADLAAEGEIRFSGARETTYLGLCLDAEPTGKSLMMWNLPKGRSLIHVVESYPKAADKIDVLRGQNDCLAASGSPVIGPTLGNLPVDAQHAWCFDGETDGCGGVIAKGTLLMAVVVEAEHVIEARKIVARLMPAAIAALDRV